MSKRNVSIPIDEYESILTCAKDVSIELYEQSQNLATMQKLPYAIEHANALLDNSKRLVWLVSIMSEHWLEWDTENKALNLNQPQTDIYS